MNRTVSVSQLVFFFQPFFFHANLNIGSLCIFLQLFLKQQCSSIALALRLHSFIHELKPCLVHSFLVILFFICIPPQIARFHFLYTTIVFTQSASHQLHTSKCCISFFIAIFSSLYFCVWIVRFRLFFLLLLFLSITIM